MQSTQCLNKSEIHVGLRGVLASFHLLVLHIICKIGICNAVLKRSLSPCQLQNENTLLGNSECILKGNCISRLEVAIFSAMRRFNCITGYDFVFYRGEWYTSGERDSSSIYARYVWTATNQEISLASSVWINQYEPFNEDITRDILVYKYDYMSEYSSFSSLH